MKDWRSGNTLSGTRARRSALQNGQECQFESDKRLQPAQQELLLIGFRQVAPNLINVMFARGNLIARPTTTGRAMLFCRFPERALRRFSRPGLLCHVRPLRRTIRMSTMPCRRSRSAHASSERTTRGRFDG
jgi:hypothetical protein